MSNPIFPNFEVAFKEIKKDFLSTSQLVHTEKWQGVDISKKPEAKTYELLNYNFSVPIYTEDLTEWREDIKANLPWADEHFLERVGGEPLNPGEQWKHWPWGNSAANFLDVNGQFNHNYMERYWPKKAGAFNKDHEPLVSEEWIDDREGIRFIYGDLSDLINQLKLEPHTRQAYLPIFFPEDTGALHGGRVPCSLGYHFILRNGYLHINYYLRSCEVYRHFRDDCYLTVRLLLWVLGELRKLDSSWNAIKPGLYSMYITSFHCFINDREKL